MSRLFVCIRVRDDSRFVPGAAEKLQTLGQTLAQIAGGYGEGGPLQRTRDKREAAAQRGRPCVSPGLRLRHKLRVAISIDCGKLCHHRRNHRINLVGFHRLCEYIAVTLLVLQSIDRVRILVDRFRSRHFIENGLVKRMQKFGVGDGFHRRERHARVLGDPLRQVVLGSGACLRRPWNRIELDRKSVV